ncbi:serine/arginine-rich splicing factor SC35-like [Camellia sinensis]|uniref:serine/arginine-rich splicing factor SC35-like n=1 Tax=Camellia sinensis TaxID=4442 RepID=UPI001035B076|nr:serine/arginine-rich splicing factor SC35-like [Camellia sinensis]
MRQQGKGGWIPVVRDRGGSGPWRSEGSAGVFNVLVDNLPASLNPKGLYNLFTKFGVVIDVFIPQKRHRMTNTRFGFVRFGCSVVANIAVQKANGLWVDDRSLQVKHTEFGKDKVRGEVEKMPLRNQVQGSVVYVDKRGRRSN